MSVRYYKTGGKRYYVIDVCGYTILPEQSRNPGRTGRAAPRTYAVLDRDECHREVAVFIPRHGVPVETCHDSARALAAELNAAESA